MPDACMYGKMGEWARGMGVPLGVAYPALIGAYSVKPNLDEMCRTRINTYVALMWEAGGGKNVTINRAMDVVGISAGEYQRVKPGGETQLAVVLGDKPAKKGSKEREPGKKKLLMVTTELGDVLRKTSMDNSTLASTLCDLWDENDYSKPLPGGGHTDVDCRLSWMGGIPANLKKPEKFLELFGGETNYGLYPRFIFGYCDKPWRYEEWDNPFKSMAINFPAEDEVEEMAFNTFACTVVTSMEEKAEAMLDQWNPPVPDAGRLRYNAKKVALLSASANSETTVTAECMRKALLFMEWQIDIRKQFKPGAAGLSVFPVLATGILAWQFQLDGQKLKGILLLHLALASVSSVMIWLVWWLHFRARQRAKTLPAYLLGLEVLGVGIIALTGHLGGFLSGVNGPG
jgi:hypothetical protein